MDRADRTIGIPPKLCPVSRQKHLKKKLKFAAEGPISVIPGIRHGLGGNCVAIAIKDRHETTLIIEYDRDGQVSLKKVSGFQQVSPEFGRPAKPPVSKA